MVRHETILRREMPEWMELHRKAGGLHDGFTPLLLSRSRQRADPRTRAADMPLVRDATVLQWPMPERLDLLGPAGKLHHRLPALLLPQRHGASADSVERHQRSRNATPAGTVLHQRLQHLHARSIEMPAAVALRHGLPVQPVVLPGSSGLLLKSQTVDPATLDRQPLRRPAACPRRIARSARGRGDISRSTPSILSPLSGSRGVLSPWRAPRRSRPPS